MNQSAILIDSHILIWLLFEAENLSEPVSQYIIQSQAVYISVASLWELSQKHKAGKLAYKSKDMVQGCSDSGLKILSVSPDHILNFQKITLANKDPFDAMLVSQAMTEQLVLVTADNQLLKSSCETFDART